MKKLLLSLLFVFFVTALVIAQNKNEKFVEKSMNRVDLCKENYTKLFGGEALTGKGTDPELMDILQKFIKTREMITCVTLTAMQTLPQLKTHSMAALNVGVTPIELREVVYQCAPFIGFPRTLNAIETLNEVFKERGIALPLETQGTVSEYNRYEKGSDIQTPLYGTEIRDALNSRFLTEVCFGDFYTRNALDIKTRELLSICILATLGAGNQIYSHTIGNLRAGNNKETLYAAMIQCLPYIGFPNALNAINIIKAVDVSE